MNHFFAIIEYFATLIEACFTFLIGGYITHLPPSRSPIIKTLISCFIVFLTVTCLNSVSSISYVTILCNFILCLLLLKWCSQQSWLLCSVAISTAVLILHSLDLSINLIVAMLFDDSQSIIEGFHSTLSPGALRLIFILSCDSIQLFLILLLRPLFSSIKSFSRSGKIALLVSNIISYVTILFVLNLILSESAALHQISLVLAEFALLGIAILLLYSVYKATQFHTAQATADILESTNAAIYNTQLQQSDALKKEYKRSHDYNHHLKVILSMIEEGTDVTSYISSLLGQYSAPPLLCDSGDPYVDAVINCKAMEASQKNIPLYYSFTLPEALPFLPVDVCAMLSNQIDNALNANLNIAKTEARYIQISIIKKQNFYLFRVENPFNPLIAVNRANPERHGFGLEIIESIANKYEGTMNIEKNGSLFINTVMLQKVETKK